jgi:hypothetical protein
MLKEASIVIFASVCIFSIIPLTWIAHPSPAGPRLSIALLSAVLFYAVYDIKKLYGNKEYHLAKNFVILIILSITLSLVIVIFTWRYFTPPTIQ